MLEVLSSKLPDTLKLFISYIFIKHQILYNIISNNSICLLLKCNWLLITKNLTFFTYFI
jgi:hypothetical protein